MKLQCGGCGSCRVCWLVANTVEYAELYGAHPPVSPQPIRVELRTICVCMGARLESCPTCSDDSRHVYDCDLHERCTRGIVGGHIKSCMQCSDWRPEVKWAYGVTTVPRRAELLKRTLASLAASGFDEPRIFEDTPNIGTPGRWFLSLWELWIRDTGADRYAIFQDDFVTGLNLQKYLDSCEYPEKGYWNLYTFPRNQELADAHSNKGWFLANQMGKGAVALVFDKEATRTLLTSQYMLDRFIPDGNAPKRHLEAIDGGVVSALKRAGYREYCHNPSLVQHTGLESSMGNRKQPLATSFQGEQFDFTSLCRA